MRELERLKYVEDELANLIVKIALGEIAKGLTDDEVKQLVIFLYELRLDLKKQITGLETK